MSRILVIGAHGVLGATVVQHLRSAGHTVIGCSRNAKDGADEYALDITDLERVSYVIGATRPSVIFHLAATFVNDYEAAFATNVIGAENILSAVRSSGVNIRVLLAGSAAEYGIIEAHDNPVQERHVLRPVSIYGLTKSWQTNYGLMCAHQGMDVVVARIFNLEGPGISDRLFIGRINLQIEEVLSGLRKRIEVGPLSAKRDYISLDRAASQLISIAERGRSGEIYHVASGIAVRMRDLLADRLRASGLDLSIVDEAQELSGRTGYDVPVIYADISRTLALSDE